MAFTAATLGELEAEYGSAAFSEAELIATSPAAREAADAELVRALGIGPQPLPRLEPLATAPPLEISDVSGGAVVSRRSCVSLLPQRGAKLKATIELPAGGIAYASSEEGVAVSLRRFADAPGVSLPLGEGPNRIRIPSDDSSVPWIASVEASEPAQLCPIGPLTQTARDLWRPRTEAGGPLSRPLKSIRSSRSRRWSPGSPAGPAASARRAWPTWCWPRRSRWRRR